MKIKPEHYTFIKSEILERVLAKRPNIRFEIEAHRKAITMGGKSKNVEMRVRWDFFCLIPSKWTCDNLYTYLDDTHIDTALKKIIAELESA